MQRNAGTAGVARTHIAVPRAAAAAAAMQVQQRSSTAVLSDRRSGASKRARLLLPLLLLLVPTMAVVAEDLPVHGDDANTTELRHAGRRLTKRGKTKILVINSMPFHLGKRLWSS